MIRLVLIFLFSSVVTFLVSAQPAITADSPAESIKLIRYNDQGYRAYMLRGTKGFYVDKTHVDVSDMTLTMFTGQKDNAVDTILLSPFARATRDDKQLTVHGDSAVRVIRANDFEVTGEQWTYDQSENKIRINKSVHVVIHTELKGILK